MPTTQTQPKDVAARPQTFSGVVISAKMKDSCVVLVKRYVKNAKYGKYQNKQTKIMAHDVGNTKKEGDTVTIEACRPMSKRKAFKIIA